MVEKDAVRRAYDQMGEIYAAQRSGHDRGTEILRQFLDSLSEPGRILDAGCGQGTPILSRVSTSATAIGVDFSRGQLRLADENVTDALLVQGDLTDLPFRDSVFDAVVAFWSVIHVPMDEHQAVFDEFTRVLRPGGRALVCEGTTEWIGENSDWLESGVEMQWNIAGADATREQLRTAGFTIVQCCGAPETLENDEESTEDDDLPWTFFDVQIDP